MIRARPGAAAGWLAALVTAVWLVDVATPPTLPGGLLYVPVVAGFWVWAPAATARVAGPVLFGSAVVGTIDAVVREDGLTIWVAEGLALLVLAAADRGMRALRSVQEELAHVREAHAVGTRVRARFTEELTAQRAREESRLRVMASVLEDTRMEMEKRRRLQRDLSARTEAMESLFSAVSHDLRSPLVTIQGFAELLTEDLVAGEVDAALSSARRVEGAAQAMESVIREVLTLHRVGSRGLSSHELQVVELARSVEDAAAHTLQGAKVELALDLQQPTLVADADLALRAWMNLLTNALQHARPEPGSTLTLGCHLRDEVPALFVRDHGPGVPDDLKERVFQRHHGDGHGLGLAIVRRIAEQHRGRAWVEDTPGGGATFWVTFAPAPSTRAPREGGIRILLVEDDPAHAALIQRAFRRFSPEDVITHVTTGEEALARLATGAEAAVAAQALVLDLHLPGIDGLGVLRAVRQDPHYAELPVIMVSSGADAVDRLRALDLQVSAFLAKPSGTAGYRDVIRQVHDATEDGT